MAACAMARRCFQGDASPLRIPTNRRGDFVRGGGGALYWLDLRGVRDDEGYGNHVRHRLWCGTAAVEHYTTQSPSTFCAQKRPGLKRPGLNAGAPLAADCCKTDPFPVMTYTFHFARTTQMITVLPRSYCCTGLAR